MRKQRHYKLGGGYLCILTKTLPHKFDRGGNITDLKGLCSKAKVPTHHFLVQF